MVNCSHSKILVEFRLESIVFYKKGPQVYTLFDSSTLKCTSGPTVAHSIRY